MNLLKSYIRPGKSSQPAAIQPDTKATPPASVGASIVPSWSPQTRQSSNYTGSRASLHPVGDFRNNGQKEIDEIKSNVAINWVYQLQGENMWNNHGPGEGVVLRKAHREFIACPMDLAHERNGLFEAAIELNAKVSEQSFFLDSC